LVFSVSEAKPTTRDCTSAQTYLCRGERSPLPKTARRVASLKTSFGQCWRSRSRTAGKSPEEQLRIVATLLPPRARIRCGSSTPDSHTALAALLQYCKLPAASSAAPVAGC